MEESTERVVVAVSHLESAAEDEADFCLFGLIACESRNGLSCPFYLIQESSLRSNSKMSCCVVALLSKI